MTSLRRIAGTTTLPRLGVVAWAADQTMLASGEVAVTVLIDARGPEGPLTEQQMDQLRAVLGFA